MRAGCLTLIAVLIVLVQINKCLNPKEEPSIERAPYAYDYVNGRPIYPEDTVYLTRHPYRFDQWIPKSELRGVLRNRELGKIPDSLKNRRVGDQLEDIINSMRD